MNGHTRRNFMKSALLAGGLLPLCPAFALGQKASDPAEPLSGEAYVSLLRQEARERAVLFKKLVRLYGSSILDVVRENTITEARLKFQQANLPRRDLMGLKETLWKAGNGIFEFEPVLFSETELKFRVSRCVFAEEMAKAQAQEIGYAFYCAWDWGFCKGFNPKIAFSRSQTLMLGQPCCDHGYTLTGR